VTALLRGVTSEKVAHRLLTREGVAVDHLLLADVDGNLLVPTMDEKSRQFEVPPQATAYALVEVPPHWEFNSQQPRSSLRLHSELLAARVTPVQLSMARLLPLDDEERTAYVVETLTSHGIKL